MTMTDKADFGIVGMAVMGQNLALNVESKGFTVAVYNRTAARTEEFAKTRAQGRKIIPTYSAEEFVETLERPRKVMLMVKAGPPVDEMLEHLMPHLEEGDILIDGGNSFFKDTERRLRQAEERGLLYLGTGVSGGEYGALHGPSLMPGGHREAYDQVAPIFLQIAAKVEDGPCCAYIGPGGAGHYIKMVHNGIEYGVMEVLAESYDLMHRGLGLTAEEMSRIYADWNANELGSYLVEITAEILAHKDEETGRPLVDLILDKAQQKGTGKWTSQNALDLGIPVPTITAAVNARIISAFKEERVEGAKLLAEPVEEFSGDRDEFLEDLRGAVYLAVMTSYAQGFKLLQAASQEYDYDLNLAEIARIWKGGCIIRARWLEEIQQAFANQPELKNLLLVEPFRTAALDRIKALRRVVNTAHELGIPVPGLSAALSYYDAYRSERLPANLIQAQRDYFGAHTYERVDKPGKFHTEWQDIYTA